MSIESLFLEYVKDSHDARQMTLPVVQEMSKVSLSQTRDGLFAMCLCSHAPRQVPPRRCSLGQALVMSVQVASEAVLHGRFPCCWIPNALMIPGLLRSGNVPIQKASISLE